MKKPKAQPIKIEDRPRAKIINCEWGIIPEGLLQTIYLEGKPPVTVLFPPQYAMNMVAALGARFAQMVQTAQAQQIQQNGGLIPAKPRIILPGEQA